MLLTKGRKACWTFQQQFPLNSLWRRLLFTSDTYELNVEYSIQYKRKNSDTILYKLKMLQDYKSLFVMVSFGTIMSGSMNLTE